MHVTVGVQYMQWSRQRTNFRNFTCNDVITKRAFPHGFWEDVRLAFAELSLKFYNTNDAVNLYIQHSICKYGNFY